MTRYTEDWRPTRRSDRLVIEAGLEPQPWFRRPIFIMAIAGALVAIGAAVMISGSGGPGIDSTITGAVDQPDPALEALNQFDGM